MSEMAAANIGTMGAEEEARSVLGSVLAQLLTMLRSILVYAMEYMRRFMQWAGEHPEATMLFIVNTIIWIS